MFRCPFIANIPHNARTHKAAITDDFLKGGITSGQNVKLQRPFILMVDATADAEARRSPLLETATCRQGMALYWDVNYKQESPPVEGCRSSISHGRDRNKSFDFSVYSA